MADYLSDILSRREIKSETNSPPDEIGVPPQLSDVERDQLNLLGHIATHRYNMSASCCGHLQISEIWTNITVCWY